MVEKRVKRCRIVERTPSRLVLHLNFRDGFIIVTPLVFGIMFVIMTGVLWVLPYMSTFIWALCIPISVILWLWFTYAAFNLREIEIDKEKQIFRVENLHWLWRNQKRFNLDQIREISLKEESLKAQYGSWPIYRLRVRYGPGKRQETRIYVTTTEFEAFAIKGLVERFLRGNRPRSTMPLNPS